jgi:hypothetical protein
MTTAIENIISALNTEIASQLSGYARIPNPYFLEANNQLFLNKGYGIVVGPGRDTERYVSCLVTWERSFTIIISNQITTTENNIDAREALEKAILVDHDKLIRAFYANTSFSGQSMKCQVSDDGGIEPFVTADNAKYFVMNLSLLVEYQEPK